MLLTDSLKEPAKKKERGRAPAFLAGAAVRAKRRGVEVRKLQAEILPKHGLGSEAPKGGRGRAAPPSPWALVRTSGGPGPEFPFKMGRWPQMDRNSAPS